MGRGVFVLLACLAFSCGGSPKQSVLDNREISLPDPGNLGAGSGSVPASTCAYNRAAGSQAAPGHADPFQPRLCPKVSERFYPWMADQPLSEALFSQIENGEQLLIVSYKDCALRTLKNCGLNGTYQFTKADRTEITEFILNRTDLHKKLPFNTRELASHFQGTGTLSIKATRVGYYTTPTSSIGLDQLAESCREGTHFVKTLDMGAFRLRKKIQTKSQTEVHILKTGGVLERCLLSKTDATSTACQSVLKVQLVPILAGGPMPDSAPHHLLKQLPGSERGRRLESSHMGRPIQLPVPGKVTLIAFWYPAEGACLETLAKLEELWQRTDKRKAQIVAVALDTTIISARNRVSTQPVTFPLVIDDRKRLSTRYQVNSKNPSVLIFDQNGYVQYYTDGVAGYLRNVEAALNALTKK